ncbi:hypothetical protein [Sinimarinibacterium sp. NLF-5-8]|uniref:hypothetical protein n=1 Tax=Sinimarinibacterium sp. NLF-5-8 TaxID=2698684 RepID=UPI00137B9405|nr:hypothetical protein [Sinimarinibacterium sp. NLF-5-8]QHS09396.1 hypothetical protein GT972_03975 [Sinimarinibacterium sp. NLF-5-8]
MDFEPASGAATPLAQQSHCRNDAPAAITNPTTARALQINKPSSLPLPQAGEGWGEGWGEGKQSTTTARAQSQSRSRRDATVSIFTFIYSILYKKLNKVKTFILCFEAQSDRGLSDV